MGPVLRLVLQPVRQAVWLDSRFSRTSCHKGWPYLCWPRNLDCLPRPCSGSVDCGYSCSSQFGSSWSRSPAPGRRRQSPRPSVVPRPFVSFRLCRWRFVRWSPHHHSARRHEPDHSSKCPKPLPASALPSVAPSFLLEVITLLRCLGVRQRLITSTQLNPVPTQAAL